MEELVPVRTRGRSYRLLESDPFGQLKESVEHLLSRYSLDWSEEWATRPVSPPIDLSETRDAIQVHIDLPGFKPDDIDVTLSGRTLRVVAQRDMQQDATPQIQHEFKRQPGTLAGTISLPCAVREEEIVAECHNGVVTITLPSEMVSRRRCCGSAVWMQLPVTEAADPRMSMALRHLPPASTVTTLSATTCR